MDESELETRLGVPVTTFDATPDTSGSLRRQIPDASHGSLAVANELTAARGRTGNAWAAPPGGVWSSTLLYPELSPAQVGRLTIAGGVATCETARSFGLDARLKWPNDVIVDRDGDRNKLAGVLTEAIVDAVPVVGKPVGDVFDEPGELEAVVMGIGVNADLDPDALDTDRAVTTIRAERGEPVSRQSVAARLHERLLARVELAETDGGFADVLDSWREHAVTLGERVRAETGAGEADTETIRGRAVDVSETGALLIETDDGTRELTDGECESVRRVS